MRLLWGSSTQQRQIDVCESAALKSRNLARSEPDQRRCKQDCWKCSSWQYQHIHRRRRHLFSAATGRSTLLTVSSQRTCARQVAFVKMLASSQALLGAGPVRALAGGATVAAAQPPGTVALGTATSVAEVLGASVSSLRLTGFAN